MIYRIDPKVCVDIELDLWNMLAPRNRESEVRTTCRQDIRARHKTLTPENQMFTHIITIQWKLDTMVKVIFLRVKKFLKSFSRACQAQYVTDSNSRTRANSKFYLCTLMKKLEVDNPYFNTNHIVNSGLGRFIRRRTPRVWQKELNAHLAEYNICNALTQYDLSRASNTLYRLIIQTRISKLKEP